MIYGVLYIPGGAEFLPSTVCVAELVDRLDYLTVPSQCFRNLLSLVVLFTTFFRTILMVQKNVPATVLAYITNTTLFFRQYWILLGLYMVDFSYALSKPTQKWHVSGIYDEATKT